MLYVHGKQLRSCLDDQLLNHNVPGNSSKWQLISISDVFFMSCSNISVALPFILRLLFSGATPWNLTYMFTGIFYTSYLAFGRQ